MMRPAALRTYLKKNILPRWVLVSGAEEYFRAETREILRSILGDGADVVEFTWSEKNQTETTNDPVVIFDEIRAGSLFADKRLIVVREADEFLKDNAAALASLLEEIPDGTCVLLEAEALLKKKGRTFDSPASLKKLVRDDSVLIDAAPLYAAPFDSARPVWESELTEWVRDKAEKSGKTMSAEAAYLLHSSHGTGLRGLVTEISKLALHVGERTDITPDDVTSLTGPSAEGSLFDVVDAVANGEGDLALEKTMRLFTGGTAKSDGSRSLDPNEMWARFTALMFTRWHEIGRVVEALKSGDEYDAAAARVFGAHRRWLFARMRRQVNARAPRVLGDAILLLADFDYRCKTTGADGAELLTRYIVETCHVSAAPASAGRVPR